MSESEGELLRNQLAKTIRDARRTVKRIHSIAPTSLTDADFEAADWICARFDVRLREPQAEPQEVATLTCNVCDAQQAVMAVDGLVDLHSAELAGWWFTSETGWLCPREPQAEETR